MTLLDQAEKLATEYGQMAKGGLTIEQKYLGTHAKRALGLAEQCEYTREMNRHLHHAIQLLEEALQQGA